MKNIIGKMLLVIAIICSIFAIILVLNMEDYSDTENEKLTLDKFYQIEAGMTYQQVVDIVGEEGTLSTESSYENQTMQIYYWYASNGISNATISFMNGKVTAKSQIGLE